MSRPPRLIHADAIYHVVSRGNNGNPIVFDAVDRFEFRRRLDGIAIDYETELFAWCLMTNHLHLVVRSRGDSLSRAMQELLGGHSRTVNRRHGRTGHLFQNRFFGVQVATDAHLISSVAYVNRNPVAAYLVERAEDWRDSSYRATIGLADPPHWLNVDFVLRIFGRNTTVARESLARVVHSGRVPVSDTIEAVRRFETRGIVPAHGLAVAA
ncbi:MAG TPA: transposase [Gaiellaceae bacterium]|nr:transposase [Gaiellaceae bacterium]